MNDSDNYIIETLKDVGLINSEQAEQAKIKAEREKTSIVDALVDEGVVSKMEVLKTVGMQLGMDVIVLAEHDIPVEVIKQVPVDIARRYRVVPVFSSETALTVALSNPLDIETLVSLRYLLKRNVEGMVASDEEISIALDHYYGLQEKNVDEVLLI